jgi:head-tail adaptor
VKDAYMADTLEQIAVQLAFQLGFVCSCRVLKDYPPDGPVCHGCRVTSRIRSALQSLAQERDTALARAVVAENHKALSLLGRSSEQESREEKLRYALAEAEIRAEEAEHALAALREQYQKDLNEWIEGRHDRTARLSVQEPRQEEKASHGLRDVQPVLTPKPDATASVVDKCRCGHMRYDHSTLKGCIGCACSRFFWVPDVDGGAVGDAHGETKPAT